jgi:CHAT domain-containing protein/Tfp pilus assembly protein PilF
MQLGRHCVLVALAFILAVPSVAWSQEELPQVELSAEDALAQAELLGEQATTLFESDEYRKAAELEMQALEIYEKELGAGDLHIPETLNNIGFLFAKMGEYTSALPFYERSVSIYEMELGANHPDVATVREELSHLYYDIGNLNQALLLHERNLPVWETILGANHPDIALKLSNLAHIYSEIGDDRGALPLYERALDIREKVLGLDHPDVATSLNNLAYLYSNMGDYVDAVPLYEREIAINEQTLGAGHTRIARSLNNLAHVYSELSENNRALPLYKRALAINEQALDADHPDLVTVLNNIGLLYVDMLQYSLALPFFERVLAVTEQVASVQLATVLGHLANVYAYLGKYDNSIEYFERQLTVSEQVFGADHLEVASVLNNLACVYSDIAEYSHSLLLHERALTIREKAHGPEHPEVAHSLNNIGAHYNELGNFSQALPLLKRALAIFEKSIGSGPRDVADTLGNLGFLHQSTKEYERALLYNQRALAIREEALGPDHPIVALNLNNIGMLYSDIGDEAHELSSYQRALAIVEKALGPTHVETSQSLNNLGNYYLALGDDKQALSYIQRETAIKRQVLGRQHPRLGDTLTDLSFIYFNMGNYSQAIDVQTEALEIQEGLITQIMAMSSESQKRSYLDTLSHDTNYTISLHQYSTPDNRLAADLALQTILRRKGRVLDAQAGLYRQVRQELAPEALSLLDQLKVLRTRRANMYNQGIGNEDPERYLLYLTKLNEDVDAVETSLARLSASFNRVNASVDMRAVAKHLPKKGALLEIVQYYPRENIDELQPPRYAAYLLKSDGQLAWADLGLTEAIDKDINHLRMSISAAQGSAPYPRELASRLYDRLLAPFAKDLSDTNHLLISPDGLLNLLPFEALVSPSGRYLLEEMQLTYLGSGRDLLRMQLKQKHRSPSLVIANPDYNLDGVDAVDDDRMEQVVVRGVRMKDLKWGSLPGTAAEAKAIQPLLKGAELLMTSEATEAALKSVVAPEILHVATHGLFAESDGLKPEEYDDPLLRSALVMAGANKGGTGENDGYLTASEAMSLDLFGTKLVVLSACETGVGEVRNGQGVYGLRRALVLAGSESQVMSLWAVGDEGTQVLMTDYYKRLRKKEGRSAALRSAKLSMISSESFSHPFYWAAFVPSGDWRNLKGKDRKVKGATGLSQ